MGQLLVCPIRRGRPHGKLGPAPGRIAIERRARKEGDKLDPAACLGSALLRACMTRCGGKQGVLSLSTLAHAGFGEVSRGPMSSRIPGKKEGGKEDSIN
jgi:hypothetical protein